MSDILSNKCRPVVDVTMAFSAGQTEAPKKAHTDDVGYDVTAASIKYSEEKQVCNRVGHEGEIIPCYVVVDTGIHLQPESANFYIKAVPNSRMSKPPFLLGNSVGTIDPNYTGPIKLVYDVLSWATMEDIENYFQVGKVVAQLIMSPAINMNITPGALKATDRGAGGFGSTAKK
jgi:dUTPase